MEMPEQVSRENAIPEQLGFSLKQPADRTWTAPGPISAQVGRPLRILIVATEAPPVRGGIARIVGYLRDGLQERGHHVDVLAYPEVGRLVFGEIRLSSLLFRLPRLFRRINEYDIVHIHGSTPTVSDIFLLFMRLRKPGLPVVYTHHVDLDFAAGFLTTLYNRLHHRLSRHARAVVAATRNTLDLMHDNRGRSSIIPYGIDLARFSTDMQKDEAFTVLFVGQFRPWKGVQVLLRAMSQVKNARLFLVGQGPEEQAYRALIQELELDVEVHVGVTDEALRQLYARAHVVVLPSISRLEAFGLTLLEGMAAGCVPVASNLPGVREVVEPVGFLFPPGDADRLAAILSNLCSNPEQVRQLGGRARLYAAGFSQDRTVEEYERLFTSVVTGQRLAEQSQEPVYVSQTVNEKASQL